MNQRAAFDETVALAIEVGMPEESTLGDSLGLAHLRSMQQRITEGTFSESKLGRWLGWAQAALVAANVGVGLEDVKQINMRHLADEPRDERGDWPHHIHEEGTGRWAGCRRCWLEATQGERL